MHCPGHQKGNDPIAKGNRLADATVWEAAMETVALALQERASPEDPRPIP